MRADRLLSILLQLQVNGRLTAGELARRLEVSERTIYRDMEALSMAGIPVVAERGSGGGWGLLEAYQTNLTGLNEAEIRALFLAQPARLLADLGLRHAHEAALIKLLAALPSMSRQDAEEARQRIHLDATGWFAPQDDLSALPTLHRAIWQERRVRLAYQRDDTAVERLVEPLGLVAKGSVWYLVAVSEGDVRTYRVGRVQAAEITEATFMRPKDFDLVTHWERATVEFKANLPRYPTVVRLSPMALGRLRLMRYGRVEHEDSPDVDGWVQARVNFEVEEEAVEWALRLGAHMEILEPPILREKIIEAAERILALYREQIAQPLVSEK